ncbi:hypothetical protein V6N13_123525 [Hibiscus sabdariffa]
MPLMSSFFGKEHQDVEGWSNNDVNRLMGDIELMGVGLDDSIIKTNEKSGAKFVGNMDHVEILKENKSGNDPSWVQAVLKQVDGDKVLLEEDDVGLVTNGKAFECPNSGPLLSHDPKKVLDLHEEEMISPLDLQYVHWIHISSWRKLIWVCGGTLREDSENIQIIFSSPLP